LWRRVDLPAAAFRGNPGACRAGFEGGCLRELPGGEAVLLRRLAGAPVRRSGVAAAAQRTLCGGAGGCEDGAEGCGC
jgi:hypothetical protein